MTTTTTAAATPPPKAQQWALYTGRYSTAFASLLIIASLAAQLVSLYSSALGIVTLAKIAGSLTTLSTPTLWGCWIVGAIIAIIVKGVPKLYWFRGTGHHHEEQRLRQLFFSKIMGGLKGQVTPVEQTEEGQIAASNLNRLLAWGTYIAWGYDILSDILGPMAIWTGGSMLTLLKAFQLEHIGIGIIDLSISIGWAVFCVIVLNTLLPFSFQFLAYGKKQMQQETVVRHAQNTTVLTTAADYIAAKTRVSGLLHQRYTSIPADPQFQEYEEEQYTQLGIR